MTSIATPLFELQSRAPATAKPCQPKKPFARIRVGSVEIPIYKSKDGRFTVAWYEGRDRKRTRRSDIDDAKDLAKQKATDMANGETYAASMSGKDRATLTRVIELLAPTGDSPELAASVYAQCRAILRGAGDANLIDVCRDFADRAARTKIIPISCEDLVVQFTEARRLNTFGKRRAGHRWMETLESQIETFGTFFNKRKFSSITAVDVDAWLDAQKVGGRTRNNYRTAFSNLVTYAKAKNFLPLEWSELARVAVAPADAIQKPILRPEQLIKLLHFAESHRRHKKFPYHRMIPFIALGAFAGIRHQEINASFKSALDWSDVDFKAKIIRVRKETAKTDARLISMPDNLVKWLLPYARRSGPVSDIPNTSAALCQLKQKAGIPAGRGQSRNTLRKSWFSYSEALKKDLRAIADEGGNSEGIAKRNYVEPQLREEAVRWFSIRPAETDGVLNLDFRAA